MVPVRIATLAVVLAVSACDGGSTGYDYESICLANLKAMREINASQGHPSIAEVRFDQKSRCCRELAAKANELPRPVLQEFYERGHDDMFGLASHLEQEGRLRAASERGAPLSQHHRNMSLAFFTSQSECMEQASLNADRVLKSRGIQVETQELGDVTLEGARDTSNPGIPY